MKLGEKAHWHIFPISIYNEAQHSCIGSNRSTSSPFFLQNMQNPDSSLVLSADAKPRLKWTSELHQRFVDAVNQLGGPDKATPKGLKRVMGIPGLTLYHLKSHLQKYRLGKHQPAETCSGSNQEDCKDNPGELDLFREGAGNPVLNPMKDLQIAQAIQIQMEVQRKLHEQIEVQRHLQLRIEAQGKYLQTVLRKAEETLSGHASSSTGVEHAKAELSQLVSMVSSGCMSSSLSELTEMRALSLEDLDRQVQTKGQRGSLESSLTSSEDSGSRARDPLVALPLLDPARPWLGGSRDRAVGQKRGEEGCLGRETSKGLHTRKETLDLNSQCQVDQDLGQAPIDLNSSMVYL